MKKIIALAVIFVLLLSMLVGCGASNDIAMPAEETMGAPAYKADAIAPEEAPEYESVTDQSTYANASNLAVADNRKLIRTLSLCLETEKYAELLDTLNKQIAGFGGYVENLTADTRYDSNSRYAFVTVRIPVEKMEEFAGAVSEVSNVVSRSESAEDVTLSYVDTESRRDALKIEQERLLALLEKAESLADIIEIENRLTDVRYELQYMETQLRTYDNLIDYATVNIEIYEVKILTPTIVEEKGFWEEIGDGLLNSLQSVWEFLKNTFSSFVIALPYLILIAAIIGVNLLIVILIVRAAKKKARNRVQKMQKEKTEA